MRMSDVVDRLTKMGLAQKWLIPVLEIIEDVAAGTPTPKAKKPVRRRRTRGKRVSVGAPVGKAAAKRKAKA